MLRAKPVYLCALGASLSVACTSPDAPSTADNAPVVGRLQTREGVNDLTLRSFADGPNAVPTNSVARFVADIAPSVRPGADDDKDPPDNNAGFSPKRGF